MQLPTTRIAEASVNCSVNDLGAYLQQTGQAIALAQHLHFARQEVALVAKDLALIRLGNLRERPHRHRASDFRGFGIRFH